MDTVPDTAKSKKNGRSVEGTILRLACLDAIITTALTFSQDESLECVGGQWLKVHLDTFTTFQTLLYYQLIRVIRKFIIEWRPTDISLDDMSVDRNGVFMNSSKELESLVEMRLSEMQSQRISVACKWFKSYITLEMSTIHDYCIAKSDATKNFARLFRTDE